MTITTSPPNSSMPNRTVSPLDLSQPRPKRRSARLAPILPYCFAVSALLVLVGFAFSTIFLLEDPSSSINFIHHHKNGTLISPNGTLPSQNGSTSEQASSAVPPGFETIVWFQVALDHIATLLMTSVVLLDLHYWWTRSVSTGISILPVIVDQALSNVDGLALNMHEPDIRHIVQFAIALAIDWPVYNLWLRLEWSWGGLTGLMPTSVRRRRPAQREKASDRIEGGFGTWSRCGAFAVLFLTHTIGSCFFGPLTYTLVTPSESAPIMTVLGNLRNASRDYVLLSQIRHNSAAQTFARTHRVSAWIAALASILTHLIPPILALCLGFDIQAPELSGLFTVALRFILLSQAFQFPTVSQKEEEED